MLGLRNINPMVRAIGTMGAVAAMVTGVTFAATGQTTNVTLTSAKLTTSTPALRIAAARGEENECGYGSSTATGWTVTGQNGEKVLVPGDSSAPFHFCLNNTGQAPLALTVNSFNVVGNPAQLAQNVTISFKCYDTTTGRSSGGSQNLVWMQGHPALIDPNLPIGGRDQCQATATLSSSYTAEGANLMFDLNFTGTSLS